MRTIPRRRRMMTAHEAAQFEAAADPRCRECQGQGTVDEGPSDTEILRPCRVCFDLDGDPREPGDDDGVEYGHPGDALAERLEGE